MSQQTKRNKLCDDILDFLLYTYAIGREYAIGVIGENVRADDKYIKNTIYKDVEGKNFEDRVREYVDSQDYESIIRVADTEMTRVYNDAVIKTAKDSGKNFYKEWVTMGDDRVRDAHAYLDGVVIPLDAKFYTYDEDSAMYPGGFELPSNNINCRCVVDLVLNSEV